MEYTLVEPQRGPRPSCPTLARPAALRTPARTPRHDLYALIHKAVPA